MTAAWSRDDLAEPQRFLDFVWDRQTGFFELAPDPSHRVLGTREEALRNVSGMTLFAPLARRCRGSTKSDIASVGNVVWADIDSRDAPERVKQGLLPLGLQPSVLVDSGNKGYWAYFKLKELIPTTQVEAINQALADLLGGDHCWSRTQLARLPNSIHPTSGRRAGIVSFSAVSYQASAFLTLPQRQQSPARVSTIVVSSAPEHPRTTFGVFPALGMASWHYIRRRPSRGSGFDRSEVEFEIFLALVAQGWSDDQIVSFANAYKLPRHTEELLRRQDVSWTEQSIRKARCFIPSSSTMCIEPVTHHRFLDRYQLLRLVHGQATGDLVAEAAKRFGCSKMTVYRALKQLEAGDLTWRERSGSNTYVHKTTKGEAKASARFRPIMLLPTVDALRRGGDQKRAW